MRKFHLFIYLFGLLLLTVGCGKHRAGAYYDYSSKIIATELDGTYTIRAWGRGRNAADAYVQARKTAVYDVIFNDLQFQTGIHTKTNNMMRPLITELNAEEKYQDYFNNFFQDKGEFENYCSMKEKRILTTNYSRTDAQTLAQVTVMVRRSELKQKLINDQIIKK